MSTSRQYITHLKMLILIVGGDAHENKPDNDINSKVMDLHNNSVGYNLGNQAIINEWSEDELLEQVINAANNGKLKILE